MAKPKIFLMLGAAAITVVSLVCLGMVWTISALKFGAISAVASYAPRAFGPISAQNAEEGLRLSYGVIKTARIMENVRRSYELAPYITVFAVMAIATAVGLLAHLLGSVITASFAVAAAFFLYLLLFGIIVALRPRGTR